MQSCIRYKKFHDQIAKASPLRGKDYCYILQSKADHLGSRIPIEDFRWIGPHVIQTLTTQRKVHSLQMNTSNTQILHRIRLRRITTDTPLDDTYANQILQPDDDIVIRQADVYSIVWAVESNHSILLEPNLYSDSVPLEHTGNQNGANHHNYVSNSTRKHKIASGSIAESPRSDTQSSQYHVNAPRTDTRITNEATRKMMVRQMYVLILFSDMTLTQLHLQR